uniref:NR LBD domain-containing protein n=1 Tax=Meloidogyne floridensis TaxID=298350 RepID=A0A915NW41_9BILA
MTETTESPPKDLENNKNGEINLIATQNSNKNILLNQNNLNSLEMPCSSVTATSSLPSSSFSLSSPKSGPTNNIGTSSVCIDSTQKSNSTCSKSCVENIKSTKYFEDSPPCKKLARRDEENKEENQKILNQAAIPRKNLIEKLTEIDRLDELINLQGLQIRSTQQNVEEQITAAQRLSHIGDEIVEQLVEWTKLLPFYGELPVEVHTFLLTHRWAELVLLSTCFFAYSSLNNLKENERMSNSDSNFNLVLLQQRLSSVMDKQIPIEHVEKEAGLLVEQFTLLFNSFCNLQITLEAYVCLKAITILHCGTSGNYLENSDPILAPPPPPSSSSSASSSSTTEKQNLNIEINTCANPELINLTQNTQQHQLSSTLAGITGQLQNHYSNKVSIIQEQFVKALQIHLSQCEDGPRLSDILNWLPMLRTVSLVLLNSKMFYVPFLICKRPSRIKIFQPELLPISSSQNNSEQAGGNDELLKAEETDSES